MGTAAAAALSGDAYVIVRLGVPSKDEVPGASTAAAGSTTSDAGVLPAATSRVYLTSGADDTRGVRINAADQVTGRKLYIANGVSNKILKVYGPSGAVINGASADAAFSSASGAGVTIICTSGSGNTWPRSQARPTVANLLASGASWLAGMRSKTLPSPSRCAPWLFRCDGECNAGNTLAEQVTGDGTSQRFASRDYLIHVTDYAFDGWHRNRATAIGSSIQPSATSI